MTQQLPPELAALAAQYAQPGGYPQAAPAQPQAPAPQYYVPPAAQQPAPAAQPMVQQPLYAPPATNVYQVPQAAAAQLIQQHLAQPLPINPPEAVQALSPDAPPPQPVKRGRGKAKPADAVAGVPLPPAADPVGVSGYTTEDLVNELAERGYTVGLTK